MARQQFAPVTLTKISAEDEGLIDVPVLAPHLEFRPIEGRQVLLLSETFNTLLRRPIHCDLLPLLNGRRTHDEIVAALDGVHSASSIRRALAALASRGYVLSGEFTMERARAAYWSSLGASPRWAEHCLTTSQVAVSGDAGHLARRLDAIGVAVGAADPTLSVVVCTDYLDAQHDAVNRSHIESGQPWVLVRPNGMLALFGPVFRPVEQGPCWACLAYRLRGHREVHEFLRNNAGDDAEFRTVAAEPAVMEAVYGFAAAEIAKWLVLGKTAPLHDQAISLDVGQLTSDRHPTARRPQCFVCGDHAQYREDRPPVPVQLRPSPKRVRNCGGVRSVPPERTVSDYCHLVSPVSGVVTWLTRTTDDSDPWLHVHSAGSSPALKTKGLSSLRHSLQNKSLGKGSTRAQSEASALCEAVERYCGAFHGEEIRHRRRFTDFSEAGGPEAVHPNAVQLFSDRQLDNAERINAMNHPFNVVPGHFDPEAEVDWSPVWSLTWGRHLYLPTSVLYRISPAQRSPTDLWSDSNGCAAGNTLEEAILQGFLELVERDAFAIWWYNRLCRPGVDLGSFGDDYLASAPDYYGNRLQREMWMLDVTNDLGIPVFVALSRRTDSVAEDIIYGSGAHPDPHIAASRAVCEMNQVLALVPRPGGDSRYGLDNPVCVRWWTGNRVAENPFLTPAPGAPLRGASEYTVPETTDARDDIEHCRAQVEAAGMEFLVLDQIRPDIGMPVARVTVPGLRHFWERFAPGRLFDVPVEMGWRAHPLAESDLNPVPVVL